MSNYRIAVIASPREWEAVSASWNDLLAKSSSDTVFLTWEWLSSWAECYLDGTKRLFVLAVYDNDELVGLAPWYLRSLSYKVFTLKQIEFLGTPEADSDYLDVIIKRGREKEVALRIYDFLVKESSGLWDRLMLCDIPANSLFLLHFSARVEEEGKYMEVRRESFCPISFLKEKGDGFIVQMSSHRKRRFNHDVKVLMQIGKVEHKHILPNAEDASLDEFLSLYAKKTGRNDGRFPAFLKNFISKCGDGKTVEVSLLLSGTRIIAGFLHLLHRDTMSGYLMATDRDFNAKVSLGNILVGLCIERAGNEGFSIYDFLKGSEGYKFRWANSGRASVSIALSQKKVAPVLFVLKGFLKNAAKTILR